MPSKDDEAVGLKMGGCNCPPGGVPNALPEHCFAPNTLNNALLWWKSEVMNELLSYWPGEQKWLLLFGSGVRKGG